MQGNKILHEGISDLTLHYQYIVNHKLIDQHEQRILPMSLRQLKFTGLNRNMVNFYEIIIEIKDLQFGQIYQKNGNG